jgi:hypothetical protein
MLSLWLSWGNEAASEPSSWSTAILGLSGIDAPVHALQDATPWALLIACVVGVAAVLLPTPVLLLLPLLLQVISMIKSSALCGSAIIAYLQAKGYPEVGG